MLGQANLPRALSDRAEDYRASYARRIGEAAFLGSRIVAPDRTIAQQEAIDLGGRVLELRAWPTAHTSTDLTVFDRTSGILSPAIFCSTGTRRPSTVRCAAGSPFFPK